MKMAALNMKTLVFLAFFVAFISAIPAPRHGRLQRLEVQMQNLHEESIRLRKLRAFVRVKFTTKFERLVQAVDALKKKDWSIRRVQYRFPGQEKSLLAQDAATTLSLPKDLLPAGTKAVFFAIKCDEWKETFSGTMRLGIKQTGNEKGGETVYNAPLNDFYYEAMIPWDSKYQNKITVQVKGSSKNLYTMSITGYIAN